ncbi:MAG: bifunctional folylpolyglutamate synthase/dihydrofolate synthase [Lachnospiraceae bacterium]|nr:bifunctional folylpolyglutamate synthase/dihydrofolate synthase [Lachnospiraceae bacterium]
MTYGQAMDYIEELGKLGSVMGLASMENLCEKLGNPQQDLSFIHIAGTNGKGSVLAFLSEILKAAGYRTGRYLSPVIFEYRERMQVNGRNISQKDLCRLMTDMKEICQELVKEGRPQPTAFEVETAMAFRYFKEKNCQIVVLETGMGGLLDATNIIPSPLVTVFTAIGFDHMKVLGGTLKEIAQNKAGIMKPGTLAAALKGEREVMEVLEGKAKELQVPLYTADPAQARGIRRSPKKQVFSYRNYKNITIRLGGVYQIDNAVLALTAAELLKQAGFPIPEKALYQGFANAFWPGRFQVLGKDPCFIADGAHNWQGAVRLRETLQFYFTNRRIIYIIGVLRDKDQDKILQELCPLASQVLTIPTKGERGLSSYELAVKAKEYHDNVSALDSVQEAVELAYLLADKDTVITAFGSLSYLGELIKVVEKCTAPEGRKDIGRDSHGKQREN